jgi:hypothetical protein
VEVKPNTTTSESVFEPASCPEEDLIKNPKGKRQKVQDQNVIPSLEVVSLDVDSSPSPVAAPVNVIEDPKAVALKKVVATNAGRKKAVEDRSRLAAEEIKRRQLEEDQRRLAKEKKWKVMQEVRAKEVEELK